MLLSNLKPVATVQYKPEGLHVLFYTTTTKATHMQDKHKRQVSWKKWSGHGLNSDTNSSAYIYSNAWRSINAMVFLYKRQRYTFPIAECTFICQCHQPNLYVMKQACCPEWGSWMNSAAIARCTSTGVVHNVFNPHELLLRFWCIGTLVNVYWIPWEEL